MSSPSLLLTLPSSSLPWVLLNICCLLKTSRKWITRLLTLLQLQFLQLRSSCGPSQEATPGQKMKSTDPSAGSPSLVPLHHAPNAMPGCILEPYRGIGWRAGQTPLVQLLHCRPPPAPQVWRPRHLPAPFIMVGLPLNRSARHLV